MPGRPLAVAFALIALAPSAAPAAPLDPSQALDAYGGPTVAGGRVLGLGGAYVGVSEGLAGAMVNPASVAQRARHLARGWDVDGVLTWYLPPVGDVPRLDVSNAGTADGRLSGVGNVLLGFGGQAGRLGAGVVARAWTLTAPREPFASAGVGKMDLSVFLGWSALHDEVVIGAGYTAAHGSVTVTPVGGPARDLQYDAKVLRAGALFRPRGRPWRLGVAVDPGARARPLGDRAAFPVTTPAAIVYPAILSVGGSAWIGPNASRYNEPAPAALAFHPEWGEGPELEASSRRPLLVTAQLDVVAASRAVNLEAALGTDAVASGERPSLVPRAGAEWELWPEVLRARGGTYLEPSRTGAAPRLHGTFGVEARVPCWPWDLQIALGGDVASRFENVALSLGFWSDLGPGPAAGVGPPRAPSLTVP